MAGWAQSLGSTPSRRGLTRSISAMPSFTRSPMVACFALACGWDQQALSGTQKVFSAG